MPKPCIVPAFIPRLGVKTSGFGPCVDTTGPRVDVGNFGHFWTTPILQPVHIADVALLADAIHDRNRVIPSCPNMEVIFA